MNRLWRVVYEPPREKRLLAKAVNRTFLVMAEDESKARVAAQLRAKKEDGSWITYPLAVDAVEVQLVR